MSSRKWNANALRVVILGALAGGTAGALLALSLDLGLPWALEGIWLTMLVLGAILGAGGTVIIWWLAVPAKWITVGCTALAAIVGVLNPFPGAVIGLLWLALTWLLVLRSRMMDDVLREFAARYRYIYEPGDYEPGRVGGRYRGRAFVVDVPEGGGYESLTLHVRIRPRGRRYNLAWRLLLGVNRNVAYLKSALDAEMGNAPGR